MSVVDVAELARSVPAGAVGVSTIDGLTGGFVRWGQVVMGARPRDAKWTHTFVVVDGEFVVEAMPGGARRTPLADYLRAGEAGDEVMLIDTGADPDRAVEAAARLVGVGYSWTTYAYLAARRLGELARAAALIWPVLTVLAATVLDSDALAWAGGVGAALSLATVWLSSSAWVLRRLSSRGDLICSQLVDVVTREAGVDMFPDRADQDVIPADVARWARTRPSRVLVRFEMEEK